MSTTTLDRPATVDNGLDDGLKVTQPRVLVSEWIKLRSLRSTVWTLIVAVGLTIGLGVLVGFIFHANWSHMNPDDRLRFDPTETTLRGALFAQLAIGVLGVLMITGEYSTGMIRATMSAVPKRLPVLWAKLAVFTAVGAVTMLVSTFAAFLIGQAILAPTAPHTTLSGPHVLRAVVGAGLYLTLVGALGLAIGFIVRNTAGAISALFGILLLLPIVGDLLPASWTSHFIGWLPSNAGQQLMTLHPDPHMLAPWNGFALFVGYVAAAIAVAAVVVKRRDA
jgi:ABC-type transport system involved in multi-copper enzyme maturation permease subunit